MISWREYNMPLATHHQERGGRESKIAIIVYLLALILAVIAY